MNETLMNPNPTPPPPSKRRGLPVWTVLVALAVLATLGALALGGILYFTRSDKAKLQRQVQELETKQAQARISEKKAAEAAAQALARTRQEEVLAQARTATNALGGLLQSLNRVTTDAAALRTNDFGRTVALHPDLVAQARRLYEVNLPALAPMTDIISRLEGVRRIEQQLLAALGTTYQPEAEVAVTAQNASLWSDQELRKIAEAQTLLAGLIQESKIKVSPTALTPQSPSLGAAIEQLNQAESAMRQRAIVEHTKDAKGEAADTLAKAEAQRILEEARLQASNLLAQANEAKAKQQREDMVRKAEGKIEDSKAKVKADQNEDEARNIELRKRAAEPDVQTKLAPFITPGYWQPKAVSYEKKPYSFTQLQSFGALDTTTSGLRNLAHLATDPRDKLRPRLKLKPQWLQNPQELEKVKEVQRLLTELGPVLVEMKLLEP